MLGTLNDKEIENLLGSQVVGRLGCHADGKTYVLPISYAYDGKYIYCHTEEGMKINIMRKNPDICFQVDKMHSMANWQSVIVWGTFEELKEEGARNEALKSLTGRALPILSSETTHLFPHWPFPSEDLSTIGGIVFRIVPTEKTGRFETNQQSTHFNV